MQNHHPHVYVSHYCIKSCSSYPSLDSLAFTTAFDGLKRTTAIVNRRPQRWPLAPLAEINLEEGTVNKIHSQSQVSSFHKIFETVCISLGLQLHKNRHVAVIVYGFEYEMLHKETNSHNKTPKVFSLTHIIKPLPAVGQLHISYIP